MVSVRCAGAPSMERTVHNLRVIVPSRDEFVAKTRSGGRVAVYQELLAAVETPLSAYWKLSSDETFSFLLESVTGGEQLARFSILGVRPRVVLRSKDRTLRRTVGGSETTDELPQGADPLDVLREALAGSDPTPVPDMPTFVGGAVGMLSYDLVRFFERLGDGPPDDLQLDDMA